MKKFINSLFSEERQLDFQYMDYDMALYLGDFRSYYLLFYINSQEELIKLWERTSDIFKEMKENNDSYNVDMDKNTMCIYCLKTLDEEYYETSQTGTISELSKKISLVEEDLNYFAKHVFLYTDKMKQFAANHVGNFDELCNEYMTKEHFQQYKDNVYDNYEYDLLINLFVKFPFLEIEKYHMRDDTEVKYRSAESFIKEKLKCYEIDSNKMQEKIKKIDLILDDEEALFEWIEQQIANDINVHKEGNE